MAEHETPPEFEDALRSALAAYVDAGPHPDDARLDALEARAPRPAPHRARAVLAAAAVVAVLVAAGVVVLRSGRDDERVRTEDETHVCGPPADDPIELPAPYRDEPRLLYPLTVATAAEGHGGPEGTATIVPGDGAAELRYPGGEVVRFTSDVGTAHDAAPSPMPTTRAEADAEIEDRVSRSTSGMTASGRVTTVETPVPMSPSFLESEARDAAELPETMARALAAGKAFAPIRQSFELGGHRIDRTIERADGIVHVSSDLTAAGTGGVRGDGRELSMLVGAVRPEAVLEADAGGRYQWILFVPAGLDVSLDIRGGDRCRARVHDDLTGGEYWLVVDGNGDDEATLHSATTGSPAAVVLSKYLS